MTSIGFSRSSSWIEHSSPIGHYSLGKSMESHYLSEEQLGHMGSINSFWAYGIKCAIRENRSCHGRLMDGPNKRPRVHPELVPRVEECACGMAMAMLEHFLKHVYKEPLHASILRGPEFVREQLTIGHVNSLNSFRMEPHIFINLLDVLLRSRSIGHSRHVSVLEKLAMLRLAPELLRATSRTGSRDPLKPSADISISRYRALCVSVQHWFAWIVLRCTQNLPTPDSNTSRYVYSNTWITCRKKHIKCMNGLVPSSISFCSYLRVLGVDMLDEARNESRKGMSPVLYLSTSKQA